MALVVPLVGETVSHAALLDAVQAAAGLIVRATVLDPAMGSTLAVVEASVAAPHNGLELRKIDQNDTQNIMMRAPSSKQRAELPLLHGCWDIYTNYHTYGEHYSMGSSC